MAGCVIFNDELYRYDWWQDQQLYGTAEQPLAFDVETRLMREISKGVTDPLDIPDLALAMAYDGKKLVLIHPNDLGRFIKTHWNQHWVGHNIQFDFWVMEKFCNERHERDGYRSFIFSAADAGYLHDSMVLDLLIQLATSKYRKGGYGEDAKLYPTNLAVLAEEFGVAELDKSDPYRLRYGELIGLSKEDIEDHPEADGFIQYALGDVIATYGVYKKQYQKALQLMKDVGWSEKKTDRYEIHPEAVKKWGVLSEAIQVRASISLAELSRTPIHVDREKLKSQIEFVKQEYYNALGLLTAECPELFAKYKSKRYNGAYKVTAKTAVPKMDTSVLKDKLQIIAAELEIKPPKSPGKLGGISTSAKSWSKYQDKNEWIKAWVNLEHYAKQLEFLMTIDHDKIYSRYDLLKRTGRTSASAWRTKAGYLLPSLNLQQMPKGDKTVQPRDCLIPREGHVFIIHDYSYLELRTLAASVLAQYGESKLADVILKHTKHGGFDPHEMLAMTILGIDQEGYKALPKDKRKESRQNAKVANFGFPGGLGVEKFIGFAANSYNLTFTEDEAKALKQAWKDTYPEMNLWLADKTRLALNYQLKLPMKVLDKIEGWKLRYLNDLCRGKKLEKNVATVAWDLLTNLATQAKRWDIVELADNRVLNEEVKRLVKYRACTLAGIVRSATKYTDGNNLPFQGLAAAGAKEAIWKLLYNGFKVVAFIHDEVIVESPEKTAIINKHRIAKILNTEMEKIMFTVPCQVEGVIAKAWTKP